MHECMNASGHECIMHPCVHASLNQSISCTPCNKQVKSNGILELNVSTNTRSSASSRKCWLMISMLCDGNWCWSLFRATCCDDIGREALDMQTTFLCTNAPSSHLVGNAMTRCFEQRRVCRTTVQRGDKGALHLVDGLHVAGFATACSPQSSNLVL